MSSAKRFPQGVPEPVSRSLSPRSSRSSDGATTTPCASSIPSSTPKSNARELNSGASLPCTKGGNAASLAEHVASADYLNRIERLSQSIGDATDQATVQALLGEGTAALGAENAVFATFVCDKGDVTSCRFMLVCDPAWCWQYLDGGLIAHDPWIAYAAQHVEPIVASMLSSDGPESRRAIELAGRSGFASAVLVPVHSGSRQRWISLLCLGSSTPRFFEGDGFGRFKLGARALACELHDWWLGRVRHELIGRVRITPDDLALLRHQRLGHTSKRIAAELRVSRSSINSRFQRMNRRLGVANRKMAARLAADCGLIRP
jgi:DNA-binding CsgD family transcriptional regulator